MVQRIACVLPQAQLWMQVAESGLDRELLVFRRRSAAFPITQLPNDPFTK
jgi:hypothetical protein